MKFIKVSLILGLVFPYFAYGQGVGINLSTPSAMLEVKGSGATDATNALEIHNSSGSNNSLVVRDDGKVGIGTSAPVHSLHVYSSTGRIRVTHTGGGQGRLEMEREGVPAAAQIIGRINFAADDDGGSTNNYAQIDGGIEDPTNGSEDGYLTLRTSKAGTNTEHVRVIGTGYVGIGTTVPVDLLHVYSTANLAEIMVQTTFTNGEASLKLQNDAQTWRSWVNSSDDYSLGDNAVSNIFSIEDGSPANSIFVESSGDVGMGTSIPRSKLEVRVGTTAAGVSINADVGISPDLIFMENGTASYWGQLGFANAAGAYSSAATQGDLIMRAKEGKIIFTTDNESGSWDPHMLINDTGAVGIGTAAPEEFLHVVQEGEYDNLMFRLQRFANLDGYRPTMHFYRAKGTKASPLTVDDEAVIGAFNTLSYDGDSYEKSHSIQMSVDGAVVDGDVPGQFKWFTSESGSPGLITKMILRHDGKMVIGKNFDAANTRLHLYEDDANNSSVTDILTIQKNSTAAVAAGIGAGIVFQIEDAGAAEEQASIDVVMDVVTDAAEEASMIFNVNKAGTMSEVMRIDGTDGFVGIGTTAPTSILHTKVTSGNSALFDGGRIVINQSATSSAIKMAGTGGNFLASANTDGGDFNLYHNDGGIKQLSIFGSGASTMDVEILDGDLDIITGNLGIGVAASGSVDLTVAGNGDAVFNDAGGLNSNVIFQTSGTEIGRVWGQGSDGTMRIRVSTSGNEMIIKDGGETTIQGALIVGDGIFHAYDAAGTTTVNNTATDLTWDTEVREDASFTHAADGSEITINTAGDYLITYECAAEVTAGTGERLKIAHWIMHDSGGGYVELAGTRAISYHRTSTTDGQGSTSIHRLVTLAATDKIKFQVQSDEVGTDDTITTMANGCRVLIERK